jgi:CelD/BcsL family acetyltransferase involved in cellulose biosynthesis
MKLELIDTWQRRDIVEAVWKELGAVCPHSYFLSWGFVETWLESLPRETDLRLAVLREGDAAIGAAFLGRARVVRQKLFRSDAWLLNQTGNRMLDQIYIEDNAILADPSARIALCDLLGQLPGGWEELYFSGVDPRSATGRMLERVEAPYRLLVANRIPAPYVELAAARQKDYLALLSANTRSQVRRCYKLYEARGPLRREVAADTATALEIFGELVELHSRWWGQRGGQGAFASSYFTGFHRSLIERRFAAGEIQLIRVRCGDETIGCLYNFVWDGTVSFYQSGLRMEDDNRLKPGFICHTEAVRHNAELGHAVYDFMASFDEYKVRMATRQRDLVWVRVQKPRLKFTVEKMMRAGALRAMAQYRKAKSGRKQPARVQTAETAC